MRAVVVSIVAALVLSGVAAGGADLDRAHAAVGAATASDRTLDGCKERERAAAVAGATISKLGTIGPDEVVIAAVHASCACGNVNCPYLVLRLQASRPAILLSTVAYQVVPFGSARPLPKLREHAHDSALVTVEAIDEYRDGRYVAVETARLRGDTGERKLNDVPIRFLAGASSAKLSGRASLGWYDDYAFVGAKGQRLTISGIASQKPLTLTLFGPKDAQVMPLAPNVPLALPARGTFHLHVENGSDTALPYTLTLSIR
ncbi:MAG: hypothetical protein GIW95_10825 [Candidatus Eremiobacteraeota bacterium]|nr:hypothetical protein [Candidatus Eremiobacteraeota bacterium]